LHDQGEHGGKIMETINLYELGIDTLELLGYSDISCVKDFEGLSLKQIRDILSDYSYTKLPKILDRILINWISNNKEQ